jgi:hypothetical protein
VLLLELYKTRRPLQPRCLLLWYFSRAEPSRALTRSHPSTSTSIPVLCISSSVQGARFRSAPLQIQFKLGAFPSSTLSPRRPTGSFLVSAAPDPVFKSSQAHVKSAHFFSISFAQIRRCWASAQIRPEDPVAGVRQLLSDAPRAQVQPSFCFFLNVPASI